MLSVLIFMPLAGGVLAALLPGGAERDGRAAGFVSLLFAAVTLGISIGLMADFESGGGLQNVTNVSWIPELGIRYKLGLDGLNLFLVAMTALLWLAATAWATLPGQSEGRPRPRLFYLMLALGETAVLGAFLAQDLALFVLFFDLMLVPFYFLVGQWGAGRREDVVAATFESTPEKIASAGSGIVR